VGFLGLLGAERLFELALSRRHIAWAKAQGGGLADDPAWPAMVALHTALPVAALAEAALRRRRVSPRLAGSMLAAVAAAQALRWTSVAALGRRWSVRIVTVPGAPAVSRGPYRYIRHPNYVAVATEVAAVPLVQGAWVTALVFSALNLWVLARRIEAEERALAASPSYRATMMRRPRFVPARSRS
jgi:methyltransferase